MSSPKKCRAWYSPSSREAIWGGYRRAASSRVRLVEMTVCLSPTSRLFTSSYRADWVNWVTSSLPRSSRISRSQLR